MDIGFMLWQRVNTQNISLETLNNGGFDKNQLILLYFLTDAAPQFLYNTHCMYSKAWAEFSECVEWLIDFNFFSQLWTLAFSFNFFFILLTIIVLYKEYFAHLL